MRLSTRLALVTAILLLVPAALWPAACSSAQPTVSETEPGGSATSTDAGDREGASEDGPYGPETTSSGTPGGTAAPGAGKTGEAATVIAVLQIVSQPALDAVVAGFVETLQQAGYREPDTRFVLQSAQGDEARAAKLAKELQQSQPDLVFAVSQPASQAAAEVITEVPVVFAAVTDPAAAGLLRRVPGSRTNVTGVSDLLPVGPHLELFRQLVPGGERLGIIYNPSDAESLAQIRAERAAAAEMGLETVEVTVDDSSEVLAAAESLAPRVQAISVLRDSTVVSALESVVKVCTDNRLPLLAADSDSVQRGAVAAWSFDYREHGRQAGRLAVRILNGAEPSEMPVETTQNLTLAVNESAAGAMGVTLPPELMARATQVY